MILSQLQKYFYITLMCLGANLAYASATATSDIEGNTDQVAQQRNYIEAKKQLRMGRATLDDKTVNSLQDFALYPYLEFEYLKRNLNSKHQNQINAFIDAEPDSYLAKQLKRLWLSRLIKQQNWPQLARHQLSDFNSINGKCQYSRALVETGHVKQADQAINELWLLGKNLPKACTPAITQWQQSTNGLPLWPRIAQSAANNQWQLSKYLVKQLDQDNRTLADQIGQLKQQTSALASIKKLIQADDLNAAAMAEYAELSWYVGLKRLNRNKPEAAIAALELAVNASLITNELANVAAKRISASLLTGNPKLALNLFQRLENSPTFSISDASLYGIRTRLAISVEDWPLVRHSILSMPKPMQEDDRWLYWQARANLSMASAASQVNNAYQSHDEFSPMLSASVSHIFEQQALQLTVLSSDLLLSELAKRRSYYGFLAAESLGLPYQLQHQSLAPSPRQHDVAALPGIQRATQLYRLGEIRDARREWAYTSKSFDREDWAAAAVYAHQQGWHYQTIYALNKAKTWNDLDKRFPTPHQEYFQQASKHHQLDNNLVVALARRESAFASDVRSGVGATGLMQLMPRTAKQTAKAVGVKYRQFKLINPEYNIKLGTHYLKTLLNQFDGNEVLALASYNAGSRSVKRWLAKRDLNTPMDVWVESIPYQETRDYVQTILTYKTIYALRQSKIDEPLITQTWPNQNHLSFHQARDTIAHRLSQPLSINAAQLAANKIPSNVQLAKQDL